MKCSIKNDHGDVKSWEKEMRQIWKKYFKRLLNVEDGKEAVISAVGIGVRKIKHGREDESIVKEEIQKALNKMEVEKHQKMLKVG